MNDQQSKDLLHLAMIQHHIHSLAPEQQVRVDYLAERLRELLKSEPDKELAQAAHALVSAELLFTLEDDQ